MGPAVLRCWQLLSQQRGVLVPHAVLRGPGGSRAADMALSRLRLALPSEERARLVQVRGQGWVLLEGDPPPLDLGWATIRPDRRVLEIGGASLPLTSAERDLLVALVEAGGRPVPRSALAQRLWGAGAAAERVDVLLCRLRARVEPDPGHPTRLRTLPQLGISLQDTRRAIPPRQPAPPPARPPDLVGRAALVEATLHALEDPRPVLLHGPPGIGKSALAQAAAFRWWQATGAPVLHLDAHDADADDDLGPRLAETLRLDDLDDDGAVCRALRVRRPLLVLDGAAPEALAPRLARWAESTGLRVLATSRVAPGTYGVLDVPPLSPTDAHSLLRREAGRPPEPEDEGTLRELEGNPLGIVLLARSLRLGAAPLASTRALVPVMPLLRAWRVLLDALSPVELLVARAAAMFRGEVPPSAPAALIGLDAEAARTVIEALVNRSIVQRQGAGLLVPAPAREVLRGLSRRDPDHAQWRARLDRWLEGFLDGELAQVGTEGGPALDRLGARWLDLDPILDLPADADPACILRLCAVAREAAERTSRHRRDRWVQSLQHQTDRPDLSAGLRARVLQATHALSWERMARSRRVETLQVALDLATAAREPVLRAAIAGELASVVAFAEGAPAARGLLDDAPMPPDAPVDERVRRMRHEGRLAGIGGDPRAGLQTLRDAVDLAFQHGLPILEARCLVAYGQALSASDPSPDAAPLLRRAVRLCDEHGLAEQGIRALIRLAQHLLRRGEREEARALLDASRERATVGGWTVLLEQSVTALGFLLIGEGRVDEAVAELDLAHTLCAELGGGRAMYVALCNRGLAHALGGHKVDSLADLRAAVALPGGPGGWLRALGLAYLTVAEALAEPAREPPALAPTQDALALVDHPARGALDDALRRLRAGPDGRTDTLAWARSWQGPGEVELVVRAVASWAASDSVTI